MSKEFKRGKKAEQNGDYAEAVKQFRLAADKDNTEAQVYLAAMLAQGRGVPQDWTAAATLLQPLADKSVPEACYSLALQYLDGNGVEPDAAKAAELLRTAGTKGHMAAQFRLGGLYATGSGVDKDEREAVRWYRKASEQSFPPAQNALGWMYEHQRGVDDKDEASCLKQALKYYRKAAEVPAGMIGEGFAVAQANLARMYATGKGLITKDHKEAVKWFRYAHLSNGLVVRAPHRMPGSSTGKPPCRAMSTRSSSSASCTSTAPACHSICERPACGTRWPPSSATSPPCISSASCTTRPSMSACRAPLRGNATTAKPSIGTRLPPSVAMPRHSSRSACATLKAEVSLSHTHTLSLAHSLTHSHDAIASQALPPTYHSQWRGAPSLLARASMRLRCNTSVRSTTAAYLRCPRTRRWRRSGSAWPPIPTLPYRPIRPTLSRVLALLRPPPQPLTRAHPPRYLARIRPTWSAI